MECSVNVVREGLLAEAADHHHQQQRMQTTKDDNSSRNGNSSSGDSSSDSDSDDDSSSVPSDDSDSELENESGKKEGKHADGSMKETHDKKLSLKNAEKWVNLDEAKKALLSLPADTYPNAPSASSGKSVVVMPTTLGSTLSKNQQRNEAKRLSASTELNSNSNDKKVAAKVFDSRFELSKGLDGLFHESTTGDDYREELLAKQKKRSVVFQSTKVPVIVRATMGSCRIMMMTTTTVRTRLKDLIG